MTINDITLKDLTRVSTTNYYYIKFENDFETGYNFFWCQFGIINKPFIIEPIDYSTILIELSPKVRGNTFELTASRLKLNTDLILEAKKLDKSICDSIFRKAK